MRIEDIIYCQLLLINKKKTTFLQDDLK